MMELKNCPFCDGQAEVVREGTARVSAQVRCTDCGCYLESNEQSAGSAWNRRASDDLLAALKELVRLKDIKERIERGSELNGEWTDYEVNKECAWQAARAAIVRYE